MKRRTLIALGAAGTVLGGTAAWLALPNPPVQRFPDFAAVRSWLGMLAASGARSTTAWSLPQVLEHLGQSIDYSIDGYPLPKSPLFQHTAGALAFAVFEQRGRMSHDLMQPIPGALPLQRTELGNAAAFLGGAIQRFEAHPGALAPHFAYGALDKAQYTRAHLMHIANHAERITPPA